MKKLLLLGVGFILFSCSPKGHSQSPAGKEFQLVNASYYNWYGGAPGMRGTNYIVNAELKNRDDYSFKELCLGDEALSVTVSQKDGHWEIKGRKAIHEEPGNLKEQQTETKDKTCAYHLDDEKADGKPILFFTYKGKLKYCILKEIEKAPDQHYQ